MLTDIHTDFEMTVHLALIHTEQLAAGCQPDCDLNPGRCPVAIEKMPRICRVCMCFAGITKIKP